MLTNIIRRVSSAGPWHQSRRRSSTILEPTPALFKHFAMPFGGLHITRVSAQAFPHALEELDLLGNRQGLNLDIDGHGYLLPLSVPNRRDLGSCRMVKRARVAGHGRRP
jgi:hypothetical protein